MCTCVRARVCMLAYSVCVYESVYVCMFTCVRARVLCVCTCISQYLETAQFDLVLLTNAEIYLYGEDL